MRLFWKRQDKPNIFIDFTFIICFMYFVLIGYVAAQVTGYLDGPLLEFGQNYKDIKEWYFR